MSTQPEALRLADALTEAAGDYWQFHKSIGYGAAAELRFLHAENEELRRERDEARRTVREAYDAGTRLTAQRDALLDALKRALPHAEDSMARPELDIDILDARAAIKAVEEGK